MKKIRDEFKELGIELENRYIIYKNQGKTTVIPYYHIQILELKGNRVVIQTGNVERIAVELPSEYVAERLFEEILLHIERTYL